MNKNKVAELQQKVDALTADLKKVKSDGLKNVLTNLGVHGKSRTPSTFFDYPNILGVEELHNIYRGDGFGRKIVDVYANEMTRNWITIPNDKDNRAHQYIVNLNAKKAFNNAIKWSRLFGGAIIFMMIDDGQEWVNPINLKNIRSVAKLAVYDRSQVEVRQFYSDASNPKLYNEPEIYAIMQNIRATGSTAGAQLLVHESRVLRFDGDILPPSFVLTNAHWGDSVLHACYNQLINLVQSYEYGSEMLHDFIVSVIGLSGLADMLYQPGGDNKVLERINLTAQTRSINNMMVLDKEDNYDKKTSVLTGLDNLIDKFVAALSAVSGIPQMVLMGQSPSGLAASGDNEIRNWYDSVKSEQEDILTDQINKLLRVVQLAKDSNVNVKDNLTFVFNPLWQLSTDEILKNQYTRAQTDDIYLTNGVYSSDAVREHLISGKAEFSDVILRKNQDPTYNDLTEID